MKPLRAILCLVLLSLDLPVRAQLPFELPPRPAGPYEIRGVVVDAKTGEPLSGVELSIQESAQTVNAPFEIIESATNGGFRFANLAAGKYTVRASRQGYAEQAFLQHENFWTGIAVGPGKDSLHVRFPLSPSATITGVVTDENGEPVRGAAVTLWTEEIENGVRNISGGGVMIADDQGRYRFEYLLAGKYSVSVSAVPWYSRYTLPQQIALAERVRLRSQGRPSSHVMGTAALDGATAFNDEETQRALPDAVYPTVYYPNSRDWHGMGWMSLQAGQVESGDFHLSPEPSAHLHIQWSGNDGGQQPNVTLLMDLPGEGGNKGIMPTVDSGSGVMEISGIAAGHYRVQEGGGPESATEMVEQEIDLSGDAQLKLEETPFSGFPIRGVIRVVEGEPKIEQAYLQLKDTRGRRYDAIYNANSQEEGRPPGSFQFLNSPSGPQVMELSILQPADAVARNIEAKGAKVTGTTIETDGSQEVSLSVTVAEISNAIEGTALRNGKPFAGAMILLIPENGKDWERLVRRDQSDSDGTFRLPTIVPGEYALLALERGWELEWSKPGVLQPFLAKARKLEMGERQIDPVTIEVQ